MLWLLARHPPGLTGQQLDAALHERGEHLVTIRAELVRLRRALAEASAASRRRLVASKPYRLVVGVDDRRRGRSAGCSPAAPSVKALDAFPGPPLPGSDGAGRRRGPRRARRRAARGRAAQPQRRGPGALDGDRARVTTTPRAWQLLDQVLPYGSPKRVDGHARTSRPARPTLLRAVRPP